MALVLATVGLSAPLWAATGALRRMTLAAAQSKIKDPSGWK